jgi:hypothetical protein
LSNFIVLESIITFFIHFSVVSKDKGSTLYQGEKLIKEIMAKPKRARQAANNLDAFINFIITKIFS